MMAGKGAWCGRRAEQGKKEDGRREWASSRRRCSDRSGPESALGARPAPLGSAGRRLLSRLLHLRQLLSVPPASPNPTSRPSSGCSARCACLSPTPPARPERALSGPGTAPWPKALRSKGIALDTRLCWGSRSLRGARKHQRAQLPPPGSQWTKTPLFPLCPSLGETGVPWVWCWRRGGDRSGQVPGLRLELRRGRPPRGVQPSWGSGASQGEVAPFRRTCHPLCRRPVRGCLELIWRPPLQPPGSFNLGTGAKCWGFSTSTSWAPKRGVSAPLPKLLLVFPSHSKLKENNNSFVYGKWMASPLSGEMWIKHFLKSLLFLLICKIQCK